MYSALEHRDRQANKRSKVVEGSVMQKLFDRRDLLKLAAALGSLIVLSRRGMAAPRGVDPRLRRAYLDSERFGQLHY